MELQLSYTNSENNAINKSLYDTTTITGTLRESSSIISPIIMVEGDVRGYNYAYIPEFNRYYFIDEITSYRNNLWILRMKVDVLMSFRASILSTQCILVESELEGADPYILNDRVWVTKVKDKTDILPFPSGLPSQGHYILITAGGA